MIAPQYKNKCNIKCKITTNKSQLLLILLFLFYVFCQILILFPHFQQMFILKNEKETRELGRDTREVGREGDI